MIQAIATKYGAPISSLYQPQLTRQYNHRSLIISSVYTVQVPGHVSQIIRQYLVLRYTVSQSYVVYTLDYVSYTLLHTITVYCTKYHSLATTPLYLILYLLLYPQYSTHYILLVLTSDYMISTTGSSLQLFNYITSSLRYIYSLQLFLHIANTSLYTDILILRLSQMVIQSIYTLTNLSSYRLVLILYQSLVSYRFIYTDSSVIYYTYYTYSYTMYTRMSSIQSYHLYRFSTFICHLSCHYNVLKSSYQLYCTKVFIRSILY